MFLSPRREGGIVDVVTVSYLFRISLHFFLSLIMIIDHIGISVSDYEQSKDFFVKALAHLGIILIMEGDGWAGFGRGEKPEFWFKAQKPVSLPIHLAFVAENREQIRRFYAEAIKAGAKDNGAPGLRPLYHPNYYGAFVIGPDGHNVEAVSHLAE